MSYKWTRLIDLLAWLETHPDYRWCFLNHEQALKNALLSKEVPIRATAGWTAEFARIEKRISYKPAFFEFGKPKGTEIDCTLNRIKIDGEVFNGAEADAAAVEKWLVQNAMSAGFDVAKTTPPSDKAIADLQSYLSTRPDSPPQIKDEVFAQLKAGAIPELGNRCKTLSRRAFDTIWTGHAPEPWTKGGRRPRG
jgi:hypothetical protein